MVFLCHWVLSPAADLNLRDIGKWLFLSLCIQLEEYQGTRDHGLKMCSKNGSNSSLSVVVHGDFEPSTNIQSNYYITFTDI